VAVRLTARDELCLRKLDELCSALRRAVADYRAARDRADGALLAVDDRGYSASEGARLLGLKVAPYLEARRRGRLRGIAPQGQESLAATIAAYKQAYEEGLALLARRAELRAMIRDIVRRLLDQGIDQKVIARAARVEGVDARHLFFDAYSDRPRSARWIFWEDDWGRTETRCAGS
jgi:hypothetical protein